MNKVFSVSLDLSNEIRNSKFETVTRDVGGNVVDVTVYNNRNTTDLTGNTVSIVYKNSKGEMYLQNTLLSSDLANGKFSFIIPQDALYLAGNVLAEIFIQNATETVTSQQFEFNVRQGIGDGGGFVPIPDIPNWIDATESLQAQLDAIVSGGTESDYRVSQALVDESNVTWPTLKSRMDNSDSMIGDTTNLQTEDKTSLVGAVNEHESQINDNALGIAQNASDIAELTNMRGGGYIINGDFQVWQRGTSFVNPGNGAFVADRWKRGGSGNYPTTHSISKMQIEQENIKEFTNFLRATFSENITLTDTTFYEVIQLIEAGTLKLCNLGKKLTVSFQARSSIANKKIGVLVSQTYGSGGSPAETAGSSFIQLTNEWEKFSITIDTITLEGKVFGSTDPYLMIRFFYCWGASYISLFDGNTQNYGAGTVDIANVKIESDDKSTPFIPEKYQEESNECKRFTQKLSGTSYTYFGIGQAINNTTANIFVKLTTMRTNPSLIYGGNMCLYDGGSLIPVTNIVINQSNKDGVSLTVSVASGLTTNRPYFLMSNADANAYLLFDAEL